MKKIRKADDDDDLDDFADTVDLSTLGALVTAVPQSLDNVYLNSAKAAFDQLGIEHSNLVNQVNIDALSYATQRGAEMVGKSLVDGVLVDNPDATWVISEATRDEIRSLVAEVQSGNLKLTDLAREIQNAGAFSPERAQLIARTETMAANAQGSLAGYKTARKNGVNVLKAWEPDEDACPICLANADQGAIGLDEDFDSGDPAPPAHPNCECVLVPVVGEDDDEGSSEDSGN